MANDKDKVFALGSTELYWLKNRQVEGVDIKGDIDWMERPLEMLNN